MLSSEMRFALSFPQRMGINRQKDSSGGFKTSPTAGSWREISLPNVRSANDRSIYVGTQNPTAHAVGNITHVTIHSKGI